MTLHSNEDIVHRVTGHFGKWQLRTIILVGLCKIPATWFTACISFTAPVPQTAEFYCIPPPANDGNNKSTIYKPGIQNTFFNPFEDETLSTDREFFIDQCYVNYTAFMLKQSGNNGTQQLSAANHNRNNQTFIACDTFKHNAEYESLVTQFDLVCSREMLVSATQAFHALGALVGGLMTLHLLKFTSPKRLMLYGMIGQIICGNLTGLVSTLMLHIYYRFLTSVFSAFMYTSGHIIVSDITSGKARIIIITLSELFASAALIVLPGIAMFCNSWSSLYLAISSSLILLIYPHRYITESPRWLLKHRKVNETLKILFESASMNKREIPHDLEIDLQQLARDLQSTPRGPLYWSIWDGSTPRHLIVFIHWAWSVSVVIYTVMILMIRLLGVKYMHVNTFCLGFAEILGICLGLYIILYCKRQWLWAGRLLIFAGITTYFIWFSPDGVKESHKAAYELIFWLILKLFNSAVLVVLVTRTGDLVTADRKPMLMLSTLCFSRFWLTVVPFTLVLGKIHYLLPMTVFATAAVSSGIMLCYLNVWFERDKSPMDSPTKYRQRSSSKSLGKLSIISCEENLLEN